MSRKVDEKFIAKSGPARKDIAWHTDDLIRNLDVLKELYPNLKVDWDMLRLACIYHDLGKMNYHFQKKVHDDASFKEYCKSNYLMSPTEREIPHGYLSVGFIDRKYLKKQRGYTDDDLKVLMRAVIHHHDRSIDNISVQDMEKELVNMQEIAEQFNYDEYEAIKVNPLKTKINTSKVPINKNIYESEGVEQFHDYIMIKGLLNKLDYAASAGDDIQVERKNDFLNESLDKMFETFRDKNPEAQMNEMQKYLFESGEKNPVVVAQTGMGKTEGGLLWIGNNKGFFTLPLKSAINAIYRRIRDDIIQDNIDNRLGLLHSDTLNEYRKIDEQKKGSEESENLDLMLYKEKTKQLSLPLTVCTLDQLFPFVFRYRGFEPVLATLSYSKIVIDEIQMYSPDLVAYLITGLKYITNMGGKFAILTATLPSVFIDFMKKEGIPFEEPRSFTNNIIRHNLKMIDTPIINNNTDVCDLVLEKYRDKKVLIICNTIKTATNVYKKMKELLPVEGGKTLNLFHSSFTRKDRGEKEREIMYVGSKECKEAGIWIATQVVEASLDIDFDLLFTELSDLSGLFQRLGRCYRKRPWESDDFNCYVYSGGVDKCSGVGIFIDEDIFDLSKITLENELTKSGKFTEETKQRLVKEMYSEDKLKETKYYNSIKYNIQKVKNMRSYSESKKGAQKEFRDIEQESIMPFSVYNENKGFIDDCISVINDKSADKLEKLSAKENIRDLMLSVPKNRFYGNRDLMDTISINDWENIYVLDVNYNFETGIDWDSIKDKNYSDFSKRIF